MDVSAPQAIDGHRRVAIENFKPCLDCGRFPIKRVLGDKVVVTADVVADGHDVVRAALLTRSPGAGTWRAWPLTNLGNDAWLGEFTVDEVGTFEYTIRGWVDAFATWHRDLLRRLEAEQDVAVDLKIGAALIAKSVSHAAGPDAARLRHWQTVFESGQAQAAAGPAAAELVALMDRYPDLQSATHVEPARRVVVDCERARYSTWYELFPRSCSSKPGGHGTLADCQAWLPRLAEMGFDVLYLPPIHPIGREFRKGKNNATQAEANDFGSPWAIGSQEGGHRAIHPLLGTLADLHQLVTAARGHGIDVALDIAYQCAPDHPYVKDHPEWFRRRPDGTIQYAENPPKKYQDIYPFDFETSDWRALWRELTEVVLYWCEQGIRVFRVDNPHTKPFAFWEYLITEVKARYPETIFLSEAFTRPKVMYRLAKLGFTQSYTYFTWRNSRAELTEYLTELTQSEVREYFRPNLWPNTPDILPEHLQSGGRPAFIARLVLAGTLGASYGIYGPAFETLEHEPREPGSEEYLHSEKYQLREWDFSRPENLTATITALNSARRENRALQSNESLRFHAVDNEQIICYSKRCQDNVILVIVNLGYHELQRGFVELTLAELGLGAEQPYRVEDLLNDRHVFEWQGARNFVELDPHKCVAHILRVVPQG